MSNEEEMHLEPRYFTPLDGLRGVAALLVVFSHYARDTNMFEKTAGVAAPEYVIGAFGVMIFFALSGFLMMNVTDRLEFNKSNVKTYFVNRFARVLPLYWFILIFTCLYQVVFGGFLGVPQSSLAFSGFSDPLNALFQHLFLVRGDSVFWTISVELLFYMLFPIIWAVTKGGRKPLNLYLIALAVFAVQIATNFDYSRIPAYSRLNSTIQFFLLGAIIYSVVAKARAQTGGAHPIRDLMLILAIISGMALIFPDARAIVFGEGISKPSNREVWSTDPYFLVVVGLLLLAVTKYRIFETILSSAPLRYLGKISFSIYLTHRFIVSVSIPLRLSEYSLYSQLAAFILVFIPSVILVSHFTYNFIERPSQKFLRGWFKR